MSMMSSAPTAATAGLEAERARLKTELTPQLTVCVCLPLCLLWDTHIRHERDSVRNTPRFFPSLIRSCWSPFHPAMTQRMPNLHFKSEQRSSWPISHLIALHRHTHNTWFVSLAHNYILSLDSSFSTSLSLPLIYSVFAFLHSLLILSPSLTLWWQCPAVMRQGQRSESHLNTDATLRRPILSLRSALLYTPQPSCWMDESPWNIICSALIIQSTGTMFWVVVPQKRSIERKTTRLSLLRTLVVSVVSACVMDAWEVPVYLLIPGASAFEMFPPQFMAHQGTCHFHVLIPSRAKSSAP